MPHVIALVEPWVRRFTVGLLVAAWIVTPAPAVASHSFNPNELIGDGAFVNIDALSTEDVQDFLNRQGGFLKDFSENGRSAAQIVVDAAHGYGDASGTLNGIAVTSTTGTVNPAVLLVTLEKEQSLITMKERNDNSLRAAMGYGCPDSGGCNAAYAGFTKQVENTAWQLRYNYERAQGRGFSDYQVGQDFCFADVNGTNCGSFGNRASAALYRFTPHVYNGNHNFTKLYAQWFITPVWDAIVASRTAAEHRDVDIAFGPGETRTVTVVMKNTGQESWTRSGSNPVKLGTSGDRDRQSPFLSGERNRAASLTEASVAPGDSGTFTLTLTAPNTPGRMTERFQLVAEGKGWFGAELTMTLYVPHPSASGVSQYPAEHPGSVDVAFGPGETRTIWARLKNTGDSTWYRTGRYPVYLGTADPHDRTSPFLGGNQRIQLDQLMVLPGQEGTFTFTVTDPAPGNGDRFVERYQLVQEGVAWFGPVVEFKFYNARAQASYVTQGPHEGPNELDLSMAPGQTGSLTLRLKNTGDATWFNSGPYPMRLGTFGPQDRSSPFLSGVRVSMDQAVVAPGQEATFTVPLTAPGWLGTYEEHFRPVMDGVQWFGPDVSWKIKVQ